MTLSRFRGIGVSAFLVLGLVAVAFLIYSPSSDARPAVSWSPASLYGEVGAGQSSTTVATFTASKNASNVTVRVVPEIAPYVTVSPSTFGVITEGASYELEVTFTAPIDALVGVLDGTIQLWDENNNFARPLPVELSIGIPIGIPTADDNIIIKDPQTGERMVCGKLLVTLREGAPLNYVVDLATQVDATITGSIPEFELYIFQLNGACTVEALDSAIAELWLVLAPDGEPAVENVEKAVLFQPYTFPNDPLLPTQQWSLDTMRAPAAWNITTGDDNIIAVIDSGIRADHEEFEGRVVTGGSDWFFDSELEDDYGHGSAVAGIAASSTNNKKGIAGVSWNATLLPWKIFRAGEEEIVIPKYSGCKAIGTTTSKVDSGDPSNIKDAVKTSIKKGAKVINMSFGRSTISQEEDQDVALGDHEMVEVLDYANRKGVLVVAAAGNDGCNLRSRNAPATHPIVLAVAATNRQDKPATGLSNFGEWVDMAAPGVDIVSVSPDSKSSYIPPPGRGGTSLSAPSVAGAANLVWAKNPKWTASQVRLALMLSGRALPNSENIRQQQFGWGRLDLLNAVQANVIFCDGQCGGVESSANGWEATGFWHRQSYPEKVRVSKKIYPSLVSLPGAPLIGQPRLPKAFHGSQAWWYGEATTGTFIGEDFDTENQILKGGGSSRVANEGELLSPPIDLRGQAVAGITFQTWWEIESVDPDNFDLLGEKIGLEVITSAGIKIVPIPILNPVTDLNGPSDQPVTSGGYNRTRRKARNPIWIPIFVDLSKYVGDVIRIRLRFSTQDELYNGFRGWLIDDVAVVGIPH